MPSRSRTNGQDPDKLDLAYTGPGTVAGRYLRMFWQPVCVSDELVAGRAMPIHVMGEDFTLYRGETGDPHVVGFRCAHRGSQLSTGWVEGDCIRCFYHGWTYDGGGQCVEQPVENSKSAAKVQIGGHPVREAMGLVFAYLGPGDPPPFPEHPGFSDWDGILLSGFEEWRFNFFQSFENSLDITHTTFVHRGTHEYSAVPFEPSPQRSEAGITMVGRRSSDDTLFLSQLGMPNILHMNFPLPPNDDLGVLIWWVPVDDECHRLYLARRVPKEAEMFADAIATWGAGGADPQELAERVLRGELHRDDVDFGSTNVIFFQDILSQGGQGRIADRSGERLGVGDKGVIMLRQLWLAELGKVANGEPITSWKSPADGPVLYYKPRTDEEVAATLEASPLRPQAADVASS